jgi:hypothetical protein
MPDGEPDGQDRSAEAGGQAPAPGAVFSLGWLMAGLFGPLRPQAQAPSPAAGAVAPARLPTVDDLPPDQRTDLAVTELGRLLPACVPGSTNADVQDAWDKKDYAGFVTAVQDVHLKILNQFIEDQPKLSAYQLGCVLCDMCLLPQDKGADFFLQEFDRHRLAQLQTWLAEASETLPEQSAATVSRSLQNWQDWADINASSLARGWAADRPAVMAALDNQGQAWHALLSGRTDSSGQTSVDAWIEAGESLLRTTRTLGLRILRRFWPVVVVVLAATGALLYLANAGTHGTASVWASVVTVAGAFGVSGASLRAAATRTASVIKNDLSQAALLDAHAWSVTWLPVLPQSAMKRYQLRRRGVAAPQVKKGLEIPAGTAVSALGERADH